MAQLSGVRVVVTGATSGLGAAMADALSLIMTEDLRPAGVAVNMLLPGGATVSGMIPDGLSDQARRSLLAAEVMGPPVVFLASEEATGLTGERIGATDFDAFLAGYRSRQRSPD
jgi:NAD(P)-dependent dehydrogenase (short-subunit alcohol dehydrogenase family)